jgi:hypothetical protein
MRLNGVHQLLRAAFLFVLLGFPFVARAAWAQAPTPTSGAQHGDIAGALSDSSNGQPLVGAEIIVVRNGQIVARALADNFGRFEFHNLPAGSFLVEAHFIGYRPVRETVNLAGSEAMVRADFHMVPSAFRVKEVTVYAGVPLAIDTRSGDQVFQEDAYHGSPNNVTSQIIQQSIAGAVRAPTGEVHIRGQHAEYTYYVDGVPVISGISGGLNETFDPEVSGQIRFQTGGWDAEYGNKNTAVINITTKIPTGDFHANVAGSGGSFGGNTQSLSFSRHHGNMGFFFSGARQATDMRQEPVLFDTLTFAPSNFHNHGEDLFGFGKVQWQPTPHDIVNLDLNLSHTKLEVPYDSTGGTIADDHQEESNGFENLGWQHEFGDGNRPTGELFAAIFHRHGSLKFLPGPQDSPQFIFYPDTTPFNLNEDRSFNTTGLKLDYSGHASHQLEWKVGALGSLTHGSESFTTVDASGRPGPASVSNLQGSDLGVYAQAGITLGEKFELRPGLRFDNHNAPFAGNQSQVSPRLRLNYYPSPATSAFLYYGRMFIPTNVEDLRAITSVADSGVVTAPTLPERDSFFEAGLVHRFPAGVVAKLSAYHKSSSPGIDDNTVPGSAIVTSVNIATVRVTGIETAVEIRPPGPVSAYLNLAVCHAHGHGPITGGFFPSATPEGDFDLDHDQRLSGVASVTWSHAGAYVSATGIYGSGLTNGNVPDASYGTGLFDFNKPMKVDPNFIMNMSAGYSFRVQNTVVRPSLFVDNLFDSKYLLKGAFFSGASVGRPRSIQAKVEVGI